MVLEALFVELVGGFFDAHPVGHGDDCLGVLDTGNEAAVWLEEGGPVGGCFVVFVEEGFSDENLGGFGGVDLEVADLLVLDLEAVDAY